MSEVRKMKCDACGYETADHHAEQGWVRMGRKLSIQGGRRRDRCATTWVYFSDSGDFDFCNLICMTAFFKKELAKAKAKERRKAKK